MTEELHRAPGGICWLVFIVGIVIGALVTRYVIQGDTREFPVGAHVQVARYSGYGEIVAHVNQLDPPVWIVQFPDGRLVVARQDAMTRMGSR